VRSDFVNRRLVNLLTLLSLLLFAATVALWVLSYSLRPGVSRVGFDRRGVVLNDGSVQSYWLKRFELVEVPHPSGVPVAAPGKPLPYLAEPLGWHFAAPGKELWSPASRDLLVRPLATLSGGAVPHPGVIEGGGFEISLWPLAALTALLPALRLARCYRSAMARRRTAKSLCPRCGYDLRATPGRCPECGTPASVSTGG
jgi:hypothetical protein